MDAVSIQTLNLNPIVKDIQPDPRTLNGVVQELSKPGREPIDSNEVFDLLRNIKDPEHPFTLEQLSVVNLEAIQVDEQNRRVEVEITPTIPHCSMITLIGLCVKVQLLRLLPDYFKISVILEKGSHMQESEEYWLGSVLQEYYCQVNKQLADKERVAAALENVHLTEIMSRVRTTTGVLPLFCFVILLTSK